MQNGILLGGFLSALAISLLADFSELPASWIFDVTDGGAYTEHRRD
jgi:hypothetical protein